jgi:hypothetical protein
MAAFTQGLSRLTGTDVDVEALKAILIFFGIGLFLSLLAIEACGLDLSLGFL